MNARYTRWLLFGALSALAVAGCGGPGMADGGTDDAVNREAGEDGASEAGRDGSRDVISTDTRDSGSSDSGSSDSGSSDSGSSDSGSSDSGTTDMDSGNTDADAGSTDVDSGGSTDVDSGGSTDGGMVLPMGDTCAGATMITPGTVSGDLATASVDYAQSSDGNNCQSASGADAVYVIDVPAGQRLTATMGASSGLDPVLNLVAGPAANCDVSPLVCLAGADSGASGTAETVRYFNTGTTDQFVYLIASSYGSSPSTTDFTLTTMLDMPSATGECGTATALTPGTLTGEAIDGATRDTSVDSDTGLCQASHGGDKVYSIVVPAGQLLSARVTATFDSVVNLIAGPAANCVASPLVCLAGADDVGSGATEAVTYQNMGTTDQTVFIVVSAYYSTTTTGTYDLTTSLAMPTSGGDTCGDAVMITAGTLTGETLLGSNTDYTVTGSNGCRSYTGHERVYGIVVPSGKRLDVTVDSPFDSVIDLVAGPASNCDAASISCIASADAHGGGTPEVTSYFNSTAADQTVFVLVAAYSSSGNSGSYDLTTSITTPPDDEACSGATVLTPGTLTGQDLVGYAQDYSLSSSNGCSSYSGTDRVYTITVPAGKRLTATATPGGSLNPVLNIIRAPAANCTASPVVCAAHADATGSSTAETVQYTNYTTTDQDVFIVVSSSSSTPTDTTFTLDTMIDSPIIGDTCASAQMISAAGTLTGQDLGSFARDYSFSSNSMCKSYNGVERAYSITVPAGMRLRTTVTGGTGLDPVIELVAGAPTACGGTTPACVSAADATGSAGVETNQYTNSTGSDQTVFIIVGSYSSTPTGTSFTLDTALDTPAAGDACTAPTVISAPGTLTGQDLAGYSRDYTLLSDNTTCQSYSGADRVYTISVPAGQRLTTTVVGGTGFNPVVDVLATPEACGTAPLACVASADATGTAGTETALFTNSGTSAQDVLIVVGSSSSSPTGTTFTLTTALATPPAGDTCGTATVISTPGVISGETLAGYARDYGAGSSPCKTSSGNDRVYAIVVPAGKRLTASADSTSDLTMDLVVGTSASACDTAPLTCVAGSDSGNPEHVSYLNTTASDQTAYIIVAAYSTSGNSATFALTTNIATPPDGDLCSTPTVITTSGTIAGESLVGFGRDYNISTARNCASYGGVERVYAVTLVAGQSLSATVASPFDAVLELIAAPDTNCSASAVTCLAGADAHGGGTPEVVNYTNTSSADQTVFIVVAAYSSTTPTTTYDLTTSLTP